MAGYRETFGANVDYAYGRGVRDIGSSLERGLSNLSNSGRGIAALSRQAQAARGRVKDLTKELGDLEQQQNLTKSVSQWLRLQNQIDATRKSIAGAKRDLRQMPFDVMEKGLGRVVKGLVSLNTSILTIGFDFLISSIKRVYELQERWTRAIGGFNMRIGGMTKGLAGAQRAATQWSGVIRGLTDGDINEGIQMFADFTDAIGRVVEQGDQFQRFGLQLARGFNLGGEGAGQLTKVLQNIGDSGDDAAETMKAMIKGANAAHVPVNLLAKDIQQSAVYMARFGKEGQKTFVTGAAWARKYTITIEQLKASVEGLDMFDEAARTASRLNYAFGTMINSMDLMMEDDPAKRLEMIRQQFLAQGMTFDKMTPKQRRYLSESLKLTEDQVAALLDAKNAGESYQDFQAKAAAKERNELDAKRMMEVQLRKTAQTMYAFGAAFDRITVAIANAIRPLLKVLGLAGQGDKDFKSFGEVMESITKTVEEFFNSLAGNEKWQKFMRTLANDLRDFGKYLKDFVSSGRAADLMGDIAEGMKSFYVFARDFVVKIIPALRPLISLFAKLSEHLDKIVIAWLALKGAGMGMSMMGQGGGMGKLGAGIVGSSVGLGAGALMGGTGAAVGGGLGGAIGSIGGPLWGALGGIMGAAVGKFVEYGIDFFFPKKKDLVKDARESLEKEQKRLADSTKLLTDRMELMAARQAAADQRRRQADEDIQKLQSQKATLDQVDLVNLEERITRLAEFRKNDVALQAALVDLMNGVKPSAEGMRAITSASLDYNTKLDSLRTTTQQLAELQRNSVELQMADRAVKQAEIDAKAKALAADKLKSGLEGRLQGAQEALGFEDVNRGDILERKGTFASRGISETIEKQRQQFIAIHKEWTEKVSRAELDQIAAEKKLEQAKFDLAQKQFYIVTRQQLLAGEGSGSFLNFLEEQKASGKSRGVLEQEFLRGKLATDTSFDTATRAGILGLSKFAEGGVVTRPTIGLVGEAGPEAVIPLRKTNFASSTNSATGGQVVTQIADIRLDGEKVGRALVRTHITGRV